MYIKSIFKDTFPTGLSSTSYSTLFKFVIEAPKCADIIVDKLDPELCNPTLILKDYKN